MDCGSITSRAEPGDTMWAIDTPWFDVAVIGVSFAVGNILFGRFEEHRPRWRRIILALVSRASLRDVFR